MLGLYADQILASIIVIAYFVAGGAALAALSFAMIHGERKTIKEAKHRRPRGERYRDDVERDIKEALQLIQRRTSI